jgi:hypothetical protein
VRIRQRWRGLAQIYTLRARRRWAYLLSLLLLLGEVFLAIAVPTPGLMGVVAIALLAVAAVGPAADGLEMWRERRRFVLHDVDVRRLEQAKLFNAEGYESKRFRGQRWINSPAVDLELRSKDVRVDKSADRYRLPDQAAAVRSYVMTSRMWGQSMFDGQLIRLASDLTAPLGDAPAALQLATYFDGECTNEMMDQVVERRSSVGSSTVAYDAKDLALDGQLLRDLRSSLCANVIGISTLGFTNDGRIVLPSQSDENARSKRQLAPSGSGSAEMARDVHAGDTLQDVVARAMARELIEECFEGSRHPPRVRTKVIGFARVVTRGGKPEFFGISYIHAPFSSVSREKLFVQDVSDACVRVDGASHAVTDLRHVRKRYGDRFSLALEINLTLLERWLVADPLAALDVLARGEGGR